MNENNDAELAEFKQRVRTVYPSAFCRQSHFTFDWSINYTSPRGLRNRISGGYNEKSAWKNAWNTIELEMLRKFES